ncbi:hypothetical protein BCR59_03745 [Klebsiella pneumoniae]|nr:hypothetical protein BCR59_03745 [Klebsiella pneumoniae]
MITGGDFGCALVQAVSDSVRHKSSSTGIAGQFSFDIFTTFLPGFVTLLPQRFHTGFNLADVLAQRPHFGQYIAGLVQFLGSVCQRFFCALSLVGFYG